MTDLFSFNGSPILPWTKIGSEESLFRSILTGSFVAFAILGIAVPLINLPPIEREIKEEPAPDLVQVIVEKKEVVIQPPKPKPKPKPKIVQTPKPIEKAEPVVVPIQKPKKQAKDSGVMAFKDMLADMRDITELDEIKPSEQLSRAGGQSVQVQRSIISAQTSTLSGGVTSSAVSENQGGEALSGRETTQVSYPKELRVERTAPRADRKPRRTIEEIRKIFDRNQGVIYAMYNRELRRNPELKGKLVLKLSISPAGLVTDCQIVSSELNNVTLERKLVARIMLFRFDEKDVVDTTINFPIDFLPV